ncbi:MAG: ABC transporter ATP-binding protein [Firmicutes bacterium]|nr:ABC transporter ATP-binding protein [Bacillota bacterium]
MPSIKSNHRANINFRRNNYDIHSLTMPKGEKEPIKSHATSQNESLNAFINRAIKETIERDNAKK